MNHTTAIVTKPTVKLRPSSANLFARCMAAAHGQDDQFVINWEGKAGYIGSALHMAARALVLHEPIPYDEMQRRFGLNDSDERDLRVLIACVRKYCDEQLHAGGWDKHLAVEQRIEGTFETQNAVYDLGGTMDVGGFSRDKTIWGTIDWKTTRLETADYAPQQMIYLWLAKDWIQRTLPPKRWPGYYQYHIVYVRDWTEEISEAYTAEQLDAWLLAFLADIEAWNGREYHPGGNCIFCPRQADCPALVAMLAVVSRALADPEFQPTAETADDDELVNLYVHISVVLHLIENTKTLLKALVVGRNNLVPGTQGCLTTSYRPYYEIDALRAWPIAAKILTEQELADACRLSKTMLLAGVGNHYPKGQKKQGKEAFWDQLCNAEAVERRDSLILELKKAKPLTDVNLAD